MHKTVLSATKTKDVTNKTIDDTVERAIDLLDYNFTSKLENIIIKPNMCYYWDYSTGETTDPRVVSAIIDYLRNKVGKDVNITVAEADASAMRTKYAFDLLGYNKLCQAKNVELINLCDGDITDKNVTVGKNEFTLPVNKRLLDADLVINVPKLKIHSTVGFTCCLKNMFGSIAKPRKYSYHPMLADTIVGINKIVKSDISVVDGFIARGSSTQKLGIALVGDNPLTTDYNAAKIIGFNPKRIKYLSLARKEKIAETVDDTLVEDNVKLAEVKAKFPSYSHLKHRIAWALQLKVLRAYTAISGDVLPPILD